jgi:uncharacterized protein YkwD
MRRAAQFILPMLIAGTFVAVLSCTSPSTDAPPAPPAAVPSAPVRKQGPRISVHELEKRVHERVNKERRKHGLPTMRWDDALGRIAAKHSKDMSVKHYFGHTSPDGHDHSYRYLKSGYACGVTVNGVLRRGAENIYRFSPSAGEDPAETIIRGWLENSEDRKNLLSSPWGREGVGIYIGPDGVLYVTMNFC